MTTMDSRRFDALTRTVSTSDTRRGVLRLLAGLPLAGVLAALVPAESEAGRRHRRNAHHRHRTGDDKDNRKGKRKGQGKGHKKRRCAQAGQPRKKGKHCCAGLSPDASGRCASAATSGPPSPQPSPTCLSPSNTSRTQGLQEAIAAAAAGTTLTLCAGTWHLSATVVIGKDLKLVGAGAGQSILDGGNAVRVLTIDAGADVTLQDLTLTKGDAPDEGGGHPEHGGGIFNRGTLTLTGGSLTLNTARYGAAIFNEGILTLRSISVTDNFAINDGGGIYNYQGTATLQADSRVTDNTAQIFGGGIANENGIVTLEADSHVLDNEGLYGGGIVNIGSGRMTLQADSHVTDNTAQVAAGGIYNMGGGSVTVNANALVCDNTPSNAQCYNVANCPNPANGICPAS